MRTLILSKVDISITTLKHTLSFPQSLIMIAYEKYIVQ